MARMRLAGRIKEPGNAWIKVCEIVLFPLTRILARRRWVGISRIPQTGPALLVANHISHLDPVFDVVFARMSGRIPHVMAKASLWDVPVVGSVLNAADQIPVKRGSGAGQEALAEAKQALADGKVVLIYPEGTVTKDPAHWPMRPRPGVAALALSGDFPVIPIAHWGSQEIYRSYGSGRRFRPLPRKDMHIVAGDPMDLSEWRAREVDKRAIRDVSYRVMEHIQGMVATLRDEAPPSSLFKPAAKRSGPAT